MSHTPHFHFIGVCGTAMGSVAAAMKRKGFAVTGSDANIYPPMSDYLRAEGVDIREGYAAANIPDDADTIVIGNAVSRGNEEAEATLDRGLLYLSLPEVMKEHFLRGKRNFIVAGTHGKTTTSSILAWLFVSAGRDPGWMIGGLPRNLDAGARFTDSDFNILEGDEYDTAFFDKRSKFLHYLPEVAVINNIEFDHADIYDDIGQIKRSFEHLLRIVPRRGRAVVNGDDPHCLDVVRDAPCPVTRVGFGPDCEARITDPDYRPEGSGFSVDGEHFTIPMSGEFNVRNAAMAIVAAGIGGLSSEEIRRGLESFEGIARRQEVRGEVGGVKVIDDFAHHPTAIRLALAALRQQHPDARLWAVFEPRSNTTKRKVFQAEIARGLSEADLAIIAPLPDPEKVAADDRLDPARVAAEVAGGKGRYLESVDEIVGTLAAEARPGDVIAILSNGGFDGIHRKLLESLEHGAKSAARHSA
jgi:UDP-N-acetylmuramate: L-alanyl-gamma-D-glutamyl-meso-diaminopimelate ligase